MSCGANLVFIGAERLTLFRDVAIELDYIEALF